MIEQHHLSERHACRLVGLSRDSYRHPPQPSELNASLGEQIRQTALVRRRFGYRRIHDMLREQFPGVNHKRIYRCVFRSLLDTQFGFSWTAGTVGPGHPDRLSWTRAI
jgi:hypothetical protein